MDTDTNPSNQALRSPRPWLLNGLLLLVFAASTIIPVHLELLPAAVKPVLPIFVGDWIGKMDHDTSKEREILTDITAIYKANYTHSEGGLIQVSLVISGQDMNNSIHRPERCLSAQGHSHITRDSFVLDLGNDAELPVSRLVSNVKFKIDDQVLDLSYQTFYWFVGHREVTNSHYKRTFIDIRDRLTGGSAQQWAYISIGSPLPPDAPESDQAVLREFIKEIATKIQTLDDPTPSDLGPS